MSVTVEQLEEMMTFKEGESLEFKEAKNNFHFETLVKYCAALANEEGGDVILGVTDKRPRHVVGSRAFRQPERTRLGLIEQLHLNIDFSEVNHPDGRVLIFHVPKHPIGNPVKYKGIYWQRQGDKLVPMSEDSLRKIFAEAGHDFSADICTAATMDDLNPEAIEIFRNQWINKSRNQSLATLTHEQLLNDAEALIDGELTYAALILFSTRKSLGRHLAQAEVIFEYRSSDASGPAQQRVEFRQGFFSFYDKIWDLINLRNDIQHFQSGLFVLDIPTFSERPVREAILNAVSHRDYQLGGSVFIRQHPRRLVIESPGGFPLGINEQNILDRQFPRNRSIANIFAKCGLVERSGQGMNLMFELSIQESKPTPDFSGTDQYQVVLTLSGEVQDPRFLQFLEKVGREKLELFSTADFLLLDAIHREQSVPMHLQSRLHKLVSMGIIEKFGRGRGVRYILSRRYYKTVGETGAYTRKKGLDRDTNKALLLKHIKENADTGSRLKELLQVLPTLSRPQVQTLLRELKFDGAIYNVGTTRAALWYPGSKTNTIASVKKFNHDNNAI
ncbi:MAG: putative DNA binding domain-containing protein [Deltaproteobacteria bacterium]|nr:putative DNA binding domain-containing protein [Deltaproteobacteria bacterium]